MEELGTAVRMAGYLEKRGKLKLMSNWKKYWFVLEGQLLLYYKSQLEYINLSACRGSLNIGIASCVRPGHGLTIQVITRTQCVTLKTKERALQEQWLQALLDSMALPNTSSLKRQSTGTQHFRYSLDNLPAIDEQEDEATSKEHEKKSTLPRRVTRRDSIVYRLRKMGGVSYGSRVDSTPLKTPRLELAHKMLNKSSSTSMIQMEKENMEGLEDSNDEDLSLQLVKIEDTFQSKLKAIQLHFKGSKMENEPSNKEVEAPKYTEINKEDDNTNKASIPISEVDAQMTNIPLKDENQNSCVLTENNLYEGIVNENNYCYDSLKTVQRKSQDDDEKVYYSSYDKFALRDDLLPDDAEPDLPPRPVHDSTKTEYDQGLEYEEVNLVQCALEKKGSGEKKHSNFKDMILLKEFRHQKLLRKASKEKTAEQSDVAEIKKKLKPSFLKKFVLKHKKEAPRAETERVPSESEEEPEYESVCFSEHPPSQGFQQQLLPVDTLSELKNRLHIEHNSDEDSEDYETIGSTTTAEDRVASLADTIPEPDYEITPPPSLTTSTEHLYAKSHKTRSQNTLLLEIPSLPPRRTNRPPSPWHDVPTNNSPAYNSMPNTKFDIKSTEILAETTSHHKQVTSFQIVPDEILNTPQGFLAIQNQWRQVEKSGEWNREHQQVAFPNQGKMSCESLDSQVLQNQTVLEITNLNNNGECMLDDENDPDSLERSIPEYQDCDRDEENETKEDMLRIHIDTSVEFREHVTVEPCEVKVCNLIDLSTNHMQDEKHEGMDRYSDELHLLLAQLAEITSAPLFHIGATKSLLIPTTTTTFTALDKELGPIRRRRHSDPDYDVPRPHGPLMTGPPDTSMSPDSLEPQPCATETY